MNKSLLLNMKDVIFNLTLSFFRYLFFIKLITSVDYLAFKPETIYGKWFHKISSSSMTKEMDDGSSSFHSIRFENSGVLGSSFLFFFLIFALSSDAPLLHQQWHDGTNHPQLYQKAKSIKHSTRYQLAKRPLWYSICIPVRKEYCKWKYKIEKIVTTQNKI